MMLHMVCTAAGKLRTAVGTSGLSLVTLLIQEMKPSKILPAFTIFSVCVCVYLIKQSELRSVLLET